jgi:kynureninase
MLARDAIETAVAALGPGPLTEAGLRAHAAPLFSQTLSAQHGRVYLANHSLGRPLDVTQDDVREGLALWASRLGDAWDAWGDEMSGWRARLAALMGAPRADCVVPKTSAGQGLRAVLNAYEPVLRVVATRGEFDSLDLILREYAHRGRISLAFVEPREDGQFSPEDVRAEIARGADLVVVSQTMFQTGQVLPELPALVTAAHAAGARVLLDLYHSLGVFPVDVGRLDVDFAVGGSYKYLRGGPGACYLYLHPRHLDSGLRTLDTGWFAKATPFSYERPDPPRYATGGDSWLESTPAILPLYQSRAGQRLVLAIGVARLRAHSLVLQRRLVALLAERGVAGMGGSEDRGAFVVVRHREARGWAEALSARGIVADARGAWLRLCPDMLTTDDELRRTASEVGRLAS